MAEHIESAKVSMLDTELMYPLACWSCSRVVAWFNPARSTAKIEGMVLCESCHNQPWPLSESTAVIKP
jgi:hypothetical protein